MNQPLVSIIIPIYNVEQYLRKCVDSVRTQEYQNLEIVLVDDGSPDACGEICDAYATVDDRVRVIHKENGGLGRARNTGLDICSGEYIMFVDSDDYLSRDAVQVLYERIQEDNSDMAVGKHVDVYADGSQNDEYCKWMKDAVSSGQELLKTLGETQRIASSACVKLYKRKLFDSIRFPTLKCGEDTWVYPQVLDRCDLVSIVNRPIYFYFQRNSSVMHNKTEPVKHDELRAILFVAQFLWNRGYRESAKSWYIRAVSKALEFQNRNDAVAIFNNYFNIKEQSALQRGASLKEKIKCVALHHNLAYSAYVNLKRIKSGKYELY